MPRSWKQNSWDEPEWQPPAELKPNGDKVILKGMTDDWCWMVLDGDSPHLFVGNLTLTLSSMVYDMCLA